MSSVGYPQTGLTADEFYSKATKETDASKRRRLFADARQSNLCTYQIYVLAAEVEEQWNTDVNRIKAILSRGVTVFKNPAGQGAHCPKVSKIAWKQQAADAERRGHCNTAALLKEIIATEL
ncbi:hypothetical protein BGZ97_009712 [Linnemannia gamsii]|jgi:hypothetical protein|uniref:Suppressor of forked domain-containing protein n=1 Tax=Linnemannia gamsii TaxID=64522 RepID=A0A9P6R9L8_9FUNG|nr:hypothetical protein BGZ97_009712 [Linnemannia gamsii]